MADNRQTARDAVRKRMAAKGWNASDLAREAELTLSTVTEFLNGVRWSRGRSLAAIDVAIGWEPGTIEGIAHGAPVPYVSPVEEHLTGVLLDLAPDAYADLQPAEREEALAAAKTTFLERAREIRRSRES